MKSSFLLLGLLISMNIFGQNWGPCEVKFERQFYFELLGGVTSPWMQYSKTNFDEIKSDVMFREIGGIGGRFHCSKNVSIGGLVTYRGLGASYPENENLKIAPNYINLYIPLEFDFYGVVEKRKTARPNFFLFVGPYVAYNISGTITSDLVDLAITENEFSKLDYGTEAGLGLRIPTYSMDGRSNLNLKLSIFSGFENTYNNNTEGYSAEEKNNMMQSDGGFRMNRGLRFSISYELSFSNKRMTTFTAGGDGKRTYKKFVNIR